MITIRIDPEARRIETVFADGAVCVAMPDYSAQRETAQRLGYGADDEAVWRMTVDHDILHTTEAVKAGLPHSPTLWAVAHGEKYPGSRMEEWAVTQVQQRINGVRE